MTGHATYWYVALSRRLNAQCITANYAGFYTSCQLCLPYTRIFTDVWIIMSVEVMSIQQGRLDREMQSEAFSLSTQNTPNHPDVGEIACMDAPWVFRAHLVFTSLVLHC